MAKFIAKLLNIFFGPSDKATARHFAVVVEQRHDALAKFMNQKPLAQYIPEPGAKVVSTGLFERGEAFPSINPAKLPPAFGPAKSKKQAILNYIKVHPKGITAQNVGKAFPAWPYSTITARISELYKSGLIVSVGTAATGSGSLASLFTVANN